MNFLYKVQSIKTFKTMENKNFGGFNDKGRKGNKRPSDYDYSINRNSRAAIQARKDGLNPVFFMYDEEDLSWDFEVQACNGNKDLYADMMRHHVL